MKYIKIILIACFLVFFSCKSTPDFEKLKAEILRIHQEFIRAHLEKDVDFMVHDLPEDFIFVTHGEILHQKKEEIRTNFDDYLNNTVFSEYRDLEDPIIGFSRDGSLAWSITKIKVKGIRTISDGTEREFDSIYAWITLYERRDDKWIRLTEVSTNN